MCHKNLESMKIAKKSLQHMRITSQHVDIHHHVEVILINHLKTKALKRNLLRQMTHGQHITVHFSTGMLLE